MSVYSMTGFAAVLVPLRALPAEAGHAPSGDAAVSFEMRSVNGRFLDLAVRLPDEWRHHEPALRQSVAERVRRGKVEVRVALSNATGQAHGEDIPVRALQRLAVQQDQIRAWLPQAAPLSVGEAMRLIQGASTSAPQVDPEAFTAVCRQGIDAFLRARALEGARLAERIEAGVDALRSLATSARPLVPLAVADMQRRFVERFHLSAQALTPAGMAAPASLEERALTEAASYAIRIDVAEELDRLTVHLDEVGETLKRGKDAGKRLDFLAQEMHREANTLGSKSVSMDLSRIAMDMKVLIEQIREQVQNIE